MFHHPLEVTIQIAVDEEDVEGALMVGDENVGLALLQMGTALHLDGDEEQPEHDACPEVGGIVAPEMATAQRAADDGDQGSKDGYEQP